MPEPDPVPNIITNMVITGLSGLMGAILSLLFGGHDLSAWQRVGCLLSGVVCAALFGPLVVLFWSECPLQVMAAAGFVMGLCGLFLVRGLLTWFKMVESRLPWIANKVLKSKTGIDLNDAPPEPNSPGQNSSPDQGTPK